MFSTVLLDNTFYLKIVIFILSCLYPLDYFKMIQNIIIDIKLIEAISFNYQNINMPNLLPNLIYIYIFFFLHSIIHNEIMNIIFVFFRPRSRSRDSGDENENIQERHFRPHFLQAPGDLIVQESKLCRMDCKVTAQALPYLL